MNERKLSLNLKRKSWGTQEDGFSIYEDVCRKNEEILEFMKSDENVRWFLDEEAVGDNHYYAYYQLNKKAEVEFKTNTLILLSSFWPLIGHYNKKFGYENFKYEDPEYLRIGKTKKAQRYESGVLEYSTLFSIVHFFNDDYEGGELYFPDHKVRIKPKKNSSIVLNSKDVRYSISPITSGEQYVFVTSYKRKKRLND